MSSQKSTFDSLQKKGWALVDAQQHFLGNLQGKVLDSSELVVLLGIKNRFGASYFQVLLRNESGEVSHQPVVAGLHNQGKYPSYNGIEIISLPSRVSTARSLALGIPPVTTPLGYMLFLVGCGTSFKDWHFAEGGSEGPRKLQGYKALKRQHTQLRSREIAQELTVFLGRLSSTESSELERVAHFRALAMLDKFKRQNKSENRWDVPNSVKSPAFYLK